MQDTLPVNRSVENEAGARLEAWTRGWPRICRRGWRRGWPRPKLKWDARPRLVWPRAEASLGFGRGQP
eukprot:2678381-Prymnesium_polylepis.1